MLILHVSHFQDIPAEEEEDSPELTDPIKTEVTVVQKESCLQGKCSRSSSRSIFIFQNQAFLTLFLFFSSLYAYLGTSKGGNTSETKLEKGICCHLSSHVLLPFLMATFLSFISSFVFLSAVFFPV